MKLEEWLRVYEQILEDFGFSREKDEEAAKLMHELAKDKLLDASILEFLRGKSVAVIGGAYGGESVTEELVITAGKAVLRFDATPHVHVTDMEEDDDVLVELERSGCILVLHAHGDNIDRIKSVVPKLRRFIATTQSVPFDRVYNFGGFTDGDRAAIIAKRFGARRIKLYGFDFEAASGTKLKKLRWAKRILEMEGLL
ncbi:MAG: 6-hydroxymethylpterin diphosphokinase MptE-like protein [Archaeoglobaceae archaeon]